MNCYREQDFVTSVTVGVTKAHIEIVIFLKCLVQDGVKFDRRVRASQVFCTWDCIACHLCPDVDGVVSVSTPRN